MTSDYLNINIIRLSILFLLFIIGIVLLIIGTRKQKRRLSTIGISFLAASGIALFVELSELRNILTAFAAVSAVIIAAISIDESRRLRQDNFERENRDRQELILIEISHWARDVIGYCKEKNSLGENGKVISRYEYENLDDIRANLQILYADGQYIRQISTKFVSLADLVNVLHKHTEEHISLLERQPVHPDVVAFGDSVTIDKYLNQLHEHRQQLVIIGVTILKEVGKIRSSILH
jgi:hypothetical protein